jgi:hypothetical protein
MNSRLKLAAVVRMLFALLVLALALALLFKAASPVGAGLAFNSIARSPASQSQDDEKSLSIERYANEPLELVDLKIRENSVKNNIKSKVKDSHNKTVLEDVKFKETDDWFKNVKVRLRNVSGRPIYGLKASLYFRPGEARMMFEMALTPKELRNLFQQPLQPGDEIDLNINEASFNKGMRYLIQYGVDASQCSVILAVDTAYFSNDFGWSQGAFIRRNPNNPKNWDAVDPPEPAPSVSPEPSPAPPKMK